MCVIIQALINDNKDLVLQWTARLRCAVLIGLVLIGSVWSYARFGAMRSFDPRGFDGRGFVFAVLTGYREFDSIGLHLSTNSSAPRCRPTLFLLILVSLFISASIYLSRACFMHIHGFRRIRPIRRRMEVQLLVVLSAQIIIFKNCSNLLHPIIIASLSWHRSLLPSSSATEPYPYNNNTIKLTIYSAL